MISSLTVMISMQRSPKHARQLVQLLTSEITVKVPHVIQEKKQRKQYKVRLDTPFISEITVMATNFANKFKTTEDKGHAPVPVTDEDSSSESDEYVRALETRGE